MTQQDPDLQEFVQTRSPEAFARLVDRYIDVVHSAATRQVRNSDTAQDVTQAVFLVLAQKAGNVRPEQPLAAWLLQVTRYAASNARREVDRRNHHERRAGEMALRHAAAQQHDRPDDFSWDELSPLLDEGMCKLRAKDRDVLVLRYFEKKSAREAAEALGISADAAEKRTTRAVAKLRDFFRGRGVSVSGVALATGLAARSAEAAPAALKPIVAATASSSIAAPAAAASIAKGTVIAMATAKTNSLIASAVIALLLIGGGGVVVYKTLAAPRERAVQIAAPSQDDGATLALISTTDATVAAPHGPNTLVFSDGSTMDLVGVTDKADPAKKWWSADGSLVAPLKTKQNITMGFPQVSGVRTVQMVFRRSHAQKDDSVSISLSAPYHFSSDGGDDKQQDCAFGVDGSLTKTNVIARVASGPWTTLERYPITAAMLQAAKAQPANVPGAMAGSPPQIQSLPGGGGMIRSQKSAVINMQRIPGDAQQQQVYHVDTAATAPATAPSSPTATSQPSIEIQSFGDRMVRSQKMAVLTVHQPFHDTQRQQQIYLITKTGQEVRSNGSMGRSGGISEYDFKVPKSEVAAIIVRSRPYEIREIHDVSLRPGVMTVPTTMPAQ